MGSASLREASEAIMANIDYEYNGLFMGATLDRAISISSDMRYWDLVTIVQSAGASAAIIRARVDLEKINVMSDLIHSKLSHLSPKHMLDVLAGFECALDGQERPRKLYTDIFNIFIQLAKSSIYIDEYIAFLRLLARRNIRNPELLNGLSTGILVNDSLTSQLRILHCCEIAGSFGALNYLRSDVGDILRSIVERELAVIPIEELWSTCTGLKSGRVWFSYSQMEGMIWEALKDRLTRGESLMTQVSRPMEFFNFIRYSGLLTNEILIGACKWANDAVYLPVTRVNAHRRPSMSDVVLLADLCRERCVDIGEMGKAIRISVVTKGGIDVRENPKLKPLRYRRRRAYLTGVDGYVESGVCPVMDIADQPISRVIKSNEEAFAPKLRKMTDQPLWKARSNAWFFRK